MSFRHKGPTKEWKVSVPIELALYIELSLVDANGKRPSYGARSALVVRLLEQYWNQLPAERKQEALNPALALVGVQTP